MTVEFLNYISKQTFETIFLVGGPVLLVSLLVGLIIGLFQGNNPASGNDNKLCSKGYCCFSHFTPYSSVDSKHYDKVYKGYF